ncbi:MAG: hypothetical protein R3Y04_04595 [Rikenellaceae bacterium]
MKRKLLFIFCLALCSSQQLLASQPIGESDGLTIDKDNDRDYSADFVRIESDPIRDKFAYKGEVLFGTTLSFGSIETENSDLFLLLDGLEAEVSYSSIKPFIGYFYRDNRCVGFRFGKTSLTAMLNSATIDLGASSDISLDIPYFRSSSKGYSYGLFHRSYIGIDKKGTFGLFAEVELMHSYTKTNTSYESSSVITTSRSENRSLELGFNPGAAVYILPNVCTTLSFGFGGINYADIKQYDSAGELTGSRTSSKLSLKFNVTAINIGVSIHVW